jgi:hypothetical protein
VLASCWGRGVALNARSAVAAFFALVLSTNPALAEPPPQLPPVHVYSEKQTDDLSACGVDYTALSAAAEQEFQRDGVPITLSNMGNPLSFYINVNAIKLISSPFDTACAANLFVKLSTVESKPITGTTKHFVGDFVYCDRSGIFEFQSADMHAHMSDAVREFVDDCIYDYQHPIF